MAYTRYLKLILSLYEQSEGNASEAERQIFYIHKVVISEKTILKYWKDAGYETKSRGGKNQFREKKEELSQEEIKKIIKEYDRYYGDPKLAALSMGYSKTRILNRWKSAGLKTRWQKETKALEDRVK